MRAFAIRRSDVRRCPKGSLLPAHYRRDGTCRCAQAREIRAEIAELNRGTPTRWSVSRARALGALLRRIDP